MQEASERLGQLTRPEDPAQAGTHTGGTAPDAGERQEDFEELIRGRYKADFDARVKKILDGRLRGLRQEVTDLRQREKLRQLQIQYYLDRLPEQEKQQCWTAYSIVTDFYTPNPNRMRDWISIPKSNGYESLHTTVSAGGRWVEVQIRTRHRGALALQGGQPGSPDQRNVAGTPARTARGHHAFAGAALRRQAGLGRDLRLHAQRRPAEIARGGFAPGLRVRHPHLAGFHVRGGQGQQPGGLLHRMDKETLQKELNELIDQLNEEQIKRLVQLIKGMIGKAA